VVIARFMLIPGNELYEVDDKLNIFPSEMGTWEAKSVNSPFNSGVTSHTALVDPGIHGQCPPTSYCSLLEESFSIDSGSCNGTGCSLRLFFIGQAPGVQMALLTVVKELPFPQFSLIPREWHCHRSRDDNTLASPFR
jgi:hypothetical protein